MITSMAVEEKINTLPTAPEQVILLITVDMKTKTVDFQQRGEMHSLEVVKILSVMANRMLAGIEADETKAKSKIIKVA